MVIDKREFPFPLSDAFVGILEGEIAKAALPVGAGVTLIFRDPGYDPESGGFHPVEIRISSRGKIEYTTDFAFAGVAPYCELGKEIDFDFSLGLFQHFGREFALAAGRELFALWQENFVSYYLMGIYTVSAEAD